MVVLRVSEWVGCLDPVDDDPFARNPGLHLAAGLELIDLEPGLGHEVRDLGSDADGCDPAGGWGLVEADGVKLIPADAARVVCDHGRIEPLDRGLGVRRGVHAAVERHLVEVADVADTSLAVGEPWPAADVGESGQHMHQLHGPGAELLHHGESREEPPLLTGPGAGPAKHHDRGCVEPLVSHLLGQLLHVGVIQAHVLPVDRHHGHHGRFEVGTS